MPLIRFLHAADVHLDSPLRGLSSLEVADGEIRHACRKAFENLIQLAIDEKVGFVVLAGDLYDGDWKDYNTGIFFTKQMARLGKHGIRVYSVRGNHDAANKMTKTLSLPDNTYIFDSKAPQTFIHEDSQVALHGQSYDTEKVTTNLASNYPPGLQGHLNIGVLHTSLDGREGHAPYAPCTVGDLHAKGYQYWALGHVHTREVVASSQGHVVFSGCLQGRNVRETGAKGATLVTARDGRIESLEEKHVDVIRWFICQVDLTGAQDHPEVIKRVRNQMLKLHKLSQGRPMVMRVELSGQTLLARTLASSPKTLEADIRNTAAEVAGLTEGKIWIEKIKNTSKVPPASKGAVDQASLGFILDKIRDPEFGGHQIPLFHEKINELVSKLPHPLHDKYKKALSGEGREADELSSLVKEGMHMLEGRLWGDDQDPDPRGTP